jgi:hypothetical protein
MAKTYDISLLPSLQEQVLFYGEKNSDLTAHVEGAYQDFLSFVDAQSDAFASRPEYEDLQRVYQLANERMEALVKLLGEEREDVEYWGKQLEKISETRDPQQWQEVAVELIENGDYRADSGEFKAWVTQTSSELKEELSGVLEDWQACVTEDRVPELAKLLEVLASDEAEAADDYDPFAELNESDDEEKPEGGCSSAQEASGGCCGRQTPCCKSKEQ